MALNSQPPNSQAPNSQRLTSSLNPWSSSSSLIQNQPENDNLPMADRLQSEMLECRSQTLQRFTTIDADTFCQQAHPDFSPVGWHLGHIGFTEAKWVLQHMAQLSPQFLRYHRLLAADGLPKAERQNLPEFDEIADYLQLIRSQVLAYLQQSYAPEQERLWQFLLQHESQHCETVAIVLAILGQVHPYQAIAARPTAAQPTVNMMGIVPTGEFIMGSNSRNSLDNEQPAHWMEVAEFEIDRYPVTCGEYAQFIDAGGYRDPQWWSIEGQAWRQQQQIAQPYYWHQNQTENQPVCGVTWYEAQAYAKFVGKRLPSEAEWEKAATCGLIHGVGEVWEWTDSWFVGYPGFRWFPYPGYSQTYFDRQHRSLRGGSWATSRWAKRLSFRNWYHPWTRVIFSGFRCCR